MTGADLGERYPAPVGPVLAEVADVAGTVRDGLTRRRGRAGSKNVHGERQLAADVWADGLLEERVAEIPGVGTYVSEEQDDPVPIGKASTYVAVDPLDGSSNLRSNNAMGTIVGIYDPDDGSVPAPGRDLVAAAFVLYGPITTMTVAFDGTVTELLLTDDGAEVLDDDVTLPDDPTVYGFGGRVPKWSPAFRKFAREIESELKLRYGGAMIADVNQVIEYGGIFGYPALESRPDGKLRLQFEANPMAYIVETAGGASSDGSSSVLDVEATSIHQRTPVFLGSPGLIERLESAVGGS